MKNKSFQTLASRLSLWIISVSAAIFLTVLSSNYFLSRQLLEEYVSELAKTTAASTAQKLETTFQNVAGKADSLASVVTSDEMTQPRIHETLKAFLRTSPEIFGMTVALEPETLIPDQKEFSPYYYRPLKPDNNTNDYNPNEFLFSDLASGDYQYRSWPWYRDVKKSGQATWSEPYLDTGGGNVLMTTYATPIYLHRKSKDLAIGATGKIFAGVATADIELDWLDDTVKKIKIGKSGFGFIVSRDDVIIAHPDKHLNMKRLIDTIDHEVLPENWSKYQDSKMSSESVYLYSPCRHRHGFCWVAIEALGNTGWKVIVVLPEKKLTASINQLTIKNTIIATSGLLLLFVIITFIARRLTLPLARLTRATKDIGAGKLDIKLPEPSHHDEIGALANDFDSMRKSLKNYIHKVQDATAKRQKLESEIQIAKDIQMSMLPGNGDVTETRENFLLYARLIPARSVGGDLYYYQHNPAGEHGPHETLDFIIGDVSDKGVPAALFMAKTITLYTRALKEKLSPGKTLSMMNDILVQNNDACMFVTALCGNINLTTGDVVIANAGHMNPIISGEHKTVEQPVNGATALGLMDDIDYPDVSFQLDDASSMIMYTDGISEAHNSNNEQYTDERLLEFISGLSAGTDGCLNAEQTGKKIMISVESFSADVAQFDDITLFILQRT